MTPLEVLTYKDWKTELYSPCYGKLLFDSWILLMGERVSIYAKSLDGKVKRFTADGKVSDCEGAEVMLFPSKNMRDWDKFSWKEGDVLSSEDEDTCVKFIEFVTNDKQPDNNYTTFRAKVIVSEGLEGDIGTFSTERFALVSEAKNNPLFYVPLTEEVLADDACKIPFVGICHAEETDIVKNMEEYCGQKVVTVKLFDKYEETLFFIRGFIAGRIDKCRRVISENEDMILKYKKGLP